MSANGYPSHVYVIPEDKEDGDLAGGFVDHHAVKVRRIQIMPPPGGWPAVLETFRKEYVGRLRRYPSEHVVLLIDFDDKVAARWEQFQAAIPDDLRDRVYVIGSAIEPRDLKQAMKKTLTAIGTDLAEECFNETTVAWGHELLRHNQPEVVRLRANVKPFLFSSE